MYNNKSILCIIPARGGSKGLPGKNIRPLLGKPLIQWSIEQGLASKYIDHVIVSTDDESIADIARLCKADVPFIRPEKLAEDETSSFDVIEHAIVMLKQDDLYYDMILLLESTSPLRDTDDIDKAIEYLVQNTYAKAIVGVAEVDCQHPDFLLKVNERLITPYLAGGLQVKRRQELDKLYYLEGSIYLSYTDSLLDKKTFYHDKTLSYIVPKYKSFEIDDITDFYIVESIMQKKVEGVSFG